MRKEARWMDYLFLVILSLFFCWLFVGRLGIFGNSVDWMAQHSVFPDYLRRQFYQTHQLFPQFALNLGGGQNIYHFAYYGLDNPIVLISYLLPFVKMADYIMGACIISLVVSICLFYYWLQNKGFCRLISILCSVLYLLATPMIFHSYNQIMFVSYMPFLCLSLIGVDHYFDKQKSSIFIIGVFLMIQCSFYFSIGGMLSLVIYGIYRYFQQRENQKERDHAILSFLKAGIAFVWPMLIAILLSGFYLVPTALSLHAAHRVHSQLSLTSLILPSLDFNRVVYDPYGIGLSSLLITVLIASLTFKKGSERFLFWIMGILLLLPLTIFVLNGGLYIRNKVLIPFVPLACFMVAVYLDKLQKNEFTSMQTYLPYLVTIILVLLGKHSYTHQDNFICLIVDSCIMLAAILIYQHKKHIRILMIPALVILASVNGVTNATTGAIANPTFFHKVTSTMLETKIQNLTKQDNDLYRMQIMGSHMQNFADLNRIYGMRQYITSVYSSSYNDDYQRFRNKTFQLERPFRNYLMQGMTYNPLFLRYMGVRYIVSKTPVQGYQKIDTNVYKQEVASPMAYATNQLMSEQDYKKQAYPYNQLAFLYRGIVNKQESKTTVPQTATKQAFDLQEVNNNNLTIKKIKNGYLVRCAKAQTMQIPIEKSDDLLFLQFKVNNLHPNHDVSIYLDKEQNKLSAKDWIYYNHNTTFRYTVSLQDKQSYINVKLSKGKYELINPTMATGHVDENENQKLYQSVFHPDMKKTKDNRIEGSINVQNDGYFITTIPYDKNFQITMDHKKIEPEKVNTAFLGFPIKKGTHKIEIVYNAPGFGTGQLISIIAVLILLEQGIYKMRKRRKQR